MVVLLLWYFGQSIAAQGVQSLLLAATTAVAKSTRPEVLRITKAFDTKMFFQLDLMMVQNQLCTVR